MKLVKKHTILLLSALTLLWLGDGARLHAQEEETEEKEKISDSEAEKIIDDINKAANEPAKEESEPAVDESKPEPADPAPAQNEPDPQQPAVTNDEKPTEPESQNAAVGAGAGAAAVAASPASTRYFGKYRLHLMAGWPAFEIADDLEQFYGKAHAMPMLGVDALFFRSFATLGLTFRTGFYKDDGHAQTRQDSGLEKDEFGPIDLTLLPFQIGPVMAMTFSSSKFLVLQGWGIAEACFFQEVRGAAGAAEKSTSSSSSGSSSSSSNSSSSADDTGDEPLVNKGWRYGMGAGVGLSISISRLDQQSTNSMHAMGLGGISLMPFIEYVKGIGSEKFNVSRTTIGAAFTFDSI